MPVRIRELHCRVTVKTQQREMPLAHQPEGPSQPSLHFARPAPEPHAEAAQPEPTQTVIEQPPAGAGIETEPNAAKKTDPRLIADRVYDLMKQEITLSRQRGGSRRTR